MFRRWISYSVVHTSGFIMQRWCKTLLLLKNTRVRITGTAVQSSWTSPLYLSLAVPVVGANLDQLWLPWVGHCLPLCFKMKWGEIALLQLSNIGFRLLPTLLQRQNSIKKLCKFLTDILTKQRGLGGGIKLLFFSRKQQVTGEMAFPNNKYPTCLFDLAPCHTARVMD